MLTPRERRFLNDAGLRILDNTASITTSTLLYGTFVLLFFVSTSTLFRRHARSPSTWVMFGMTVTSFVLASLYWAAYAAFLVRYLRKTLLDSVHRPLDDTRLDDIDESDFKIDRITVCTRQVLQIVGDMIVVWRAWALCMDHRWAILLPLALLFGTCASSFAFLALTSTLDGYNAYIFDGERVTAALYKAANSLSLATNVFSTSLIAYILWSHRKHWNITIGGSWSRAQTILLMIIESGALYGAFQLMTVIVVNQDIDPDTPKAYFVDLVYESAVQITAMYPTIVLLLIDRKRSFTNLHGLSTTALGSLSQESGFEFSLHVPRSAHEVQGWIG
ncbi:hypothetical protein FPV67DRAFT_583146 [Lyophyllum atratum]|nr:hypothetical protein FPV67DRAFT_583146 [Lyophyllum atratum]